MVDYQTLRERFNPDGSQLRRQQMGMLDILKEIDSICQRHHIRYWLSSGTLIGSIRHNGFIPWDDDLDIEMMRSDYLQLMKILPQELPERYVLQNDDTDENYFFFYAKVRDRYSFLKEMVDYDRLWKEHGIYIDIFPIERHPIWIHKLGECTFGHVYKILRTSKDYVKSMRKVKAIFRLNKYLIYPILRLFCNLLPGRVVTSGMGIPFHNPRYTSEIFPLTTHEFEGLQFPVPHDADAHLRHIFGNYMQLPDLTKLNLHVSKLNFYDNPVV